MQIKCQNMNMIPSAIPWKYKQTNVPLIKALLQLRTLLILPKKIIVLRKNRYF